MPPGREKAGTGSKPTSRHDPYQTDAAQRKTRRTPSSTDPKNVVKRPRGSVLHRDACMQCVQKRYPEYISKLRHDFDLFVLASYDGPAEGIPDYLEMQLGRRVGDLGSLDAVLEEAKQTLDEYVTITGMKPMESTQHVYTRPIPNSEYSVRLWPGDARVGEFCMDFVHSETQEPVNSPFAYELWSVPNPAAPWLPTPTVRLKTLETCFGIAKHDLRAGEEKFVLKEGQTCLLKRPGHRNVRFTVPVWSRPASNAENVDVLDFPQVLD